MPRSSRPLGPLLLAAWLPFIGESVPGAPYIAEFQASNNGGSRDEDGDTSDWIEICNPDAADVPLEGMSLTDDPGQPYKWELPGITLRAGERLLVWASGKNRSDPSLPLHANFSLNAAGEYLALTAADGVTKLSEFNPFPVQPEGRSYGRSRPLSWQQVIAPGAACRWHVPLSGVPGWEGLDFDDVSWAAAQTGIGYDQQPEGVDFNPLIGSGGDIESAIYGDSTSCYVRIPFTVTEAARVVTMRLKLRYDDGCAVFLNGVRLDPPAGETTGAPDDLGYSSEATGRRADIDAVTGQVFDISSQRDLLVEGGNVLAIQVLNSNRYSPDCLLVPELELGKINEALPFLTGYYAVPTPEAAAGAPPVEGFVAPPVFSHTRAFLTSPVSLTLSSGTPLATIRYTVDGTVPTATGGIPYTGSVPVASTTVLHAVAFREGWEPSSVISHTFIFPAQVLNQPALPSGFAAHWGWGYDEATELFNSSDTVPPDYRMDPGITQSAKYGPQLIPALTETLPMLSLAAPVEAIFGTNGIYTNGRIDRSEITASVEYLDPLNGQSFQRTAGLRIHGGNAAGEHPKKPFRLYFRRKYDGAGDLDFPLYPGSSVTRFDKLQLRPGGHDGWAVPFGSGSDALGRHGIYLRDRFLRRTELDMGRLAPRGRYVHLYLNGLYWGVYDLHEVPGSEFYASHLGGKKDEWDALEHTNTNVPAFRTVDGEGTSFDALLELCRPASRLEDDAAYAAVRELVDVDDFIDHLIVQMWAANNDWVGPVFRGTGTQNASRFSNKNWQAGIRSRGGNPGRLVWGVWDGEITMGSSLSSYVNEMRVLDYDLTRVGLPYSESGVPLIPGPPGEIYHALRQNQQFRTRFASRLRKHLFNGGVLAPESSLSRLMELQTQLHSPLVAESARWGDVNSGNPQVITFGRDEHWLSEINWMKQEYIPQRNDILLEQFAAIGIWPQLPAPEISPAGGSAQPGDLVTLTAQEGADIFYTLDGTDPMTDVTTRRTVLVSSETIARYKIPTSPDPANAWKNLAAPADLAAWGTGRGGFGFDADGSFSGYIRTDVGGMENVNATLYVRFPFTLTAQQMQGITRLGLNLRYDDGVRVYLNGSALPVLEMNAPETAPAFNDAATDARPNSSVTAFRYFNLSPYIPGLLQGSNVLAIQGLNIDAADDDFLLDAELVAYAETARAASPSALPYSGPFPLVSDSVVRARAFDGSEWSPLSEAAFDVDGPKIVVSEIYYNPTLREGEAAAGFTAQQFEFLELMNTGSEPISLQGYQFTAGITLNFPAALVVEPHSKLVFVSNAAAFAHRHPGVPIAGVFLNNTNLSNGGERLALQDSEGRVVFDFEYDNNAPWPLAADGQGSSLVLIDPSDRPDPALPYHWRASTVAGGTPGGTDALSYEAWAAANGTSNNPEEDSDRDGTANLIQYALMADSVGRFYYAEIQPLSVNNIPGNYLVLHFTRNILSEEVRIIPEFSHDMQDWIPLGSPLVPVYATATGAKSLAFRAPSPVSGDRRIFMRVRAELRNP